MKKIYFMGILLLLSTCVLGSVSFLPATKTITVRAYTDEQKKQAKAWLSAHGYPPTMEGAYQAYQDYLSGKLTLSEEEQKIVNKNTGKSSKKKKTNSKKKTKSKKKKSSKKKDKVATEPKVETSREEATKEKKAAVSPTPTIENEDTPGGKEAESIKKCATEDTSQSDIGNSWKGVAICIGGGIILLFVVVLVCVRRGKSFK